MLPRLGAAQSTVVVRLRVQRPDVVHAAATCARFHRFCTTSLLRLRRESAAPSALAAFHRTTQGADASSTETETASRFSDVAAMNENDVRERERMCVCVVPMRSEARKGQTFQNCLQTSPPKSCSALSLSMQQARQERERERESGGARGGGSPHPLPWRQKELCERKSEIPQIEGRRDGEERSVRDGESGRESVHSVLHLSLLCAFRSVKNARHHAPAQRKMPWCKRFFRQSQLLCTYPGGQ